MLNVIAVCHSTQFLHHLLTLLLTVNLLPSYLVNTIVQPQSLFAIASVLMPEAGLLDVSIGDIEVLESLYAHCQHVDIGSYLETSPFVKQKVLSDSLFIGHLWIHSNYLFYSS